MISARLALPAAILLVLLPGAFLAAAGDGQPQKLSLPPLWSFSPDLSFPSSDASALNSYSEMAPFSRFTPLLSSIAFSAGSKGFSFGFLSLFQTPSAPPSQISLCICLGVRSRRAAAESRPFLLPVWTVDIAKTRQQAMQALARLQVDANKKLSLLDRDGAELWAVGGVGSMEMQSNGNLVIYGDGANASAVWQSFDHPTDTAVPGQSLNLAMKLTSRNGMYKVVMEAGGLLFYLVSASPVPLAYWLYSANDTVNQHFMDMEAAFSLDRKAAINMTAALRSPICSTATNASLAYHVLAERSHTIRDACGYTRTTLLNYTVDFARLDDDGALRMYSLHELPNASYTVTSNRSNRRTCFLPNACGAYGICFATNAFGTAVQHSCSSCRQGALRSTILYDECKFIKEDRHGRKQGAKFLWLF